MIYEIFNQTQMQFLGYFLFTRKYYIMLSTANIVNL
jgi:hypothetical protein